MKIDKRVFLLLIGLLAGCGEPIELNRGLSENDANEAISMLGRYQIGAEKRVDKTGVTLVIDAKTWNVPSIFSMRRAYRSNHVLIWARSFRKVV